jgi:hypothetical protein
LKALPFLGITAAAIHFMWGVSRKHHVLEKQY